MFQFSCILTFRRWRSAAYAELDRHYPNFCIKVMTNFKNPTYLRLPQIQYHFTVVFAKIYVQLNRSFGKSFPKTLTFLFQIAICDTKIGIAIFAHKEWFCFKIFKTKLFELFAGSYINYYKKSLFNILVIFHKKFITLDIDWRTEYNKIDFKKNLIQNGI